MFFMYFILMSILKMHRLRPLAQTHGQNYKHMLRIYNQYSWPTLSPLSVLNGWRVALSWRSHRLVLLREPAGGAKRNQWTRRSRPTKGRFAWQVINLISIPFFWYLVRHRFRRFVENGSWNLSNIFMELFKFLLVDVIFRLDCFVVRLVYRIIYFEPKNLKIE